MGILEKISDRRINLSLEYTSPVFLLEKNGVGCFPAGDIIAIKAKAKNGKTHAASCIEAAALIGDYMGFKAIERGLKVVYVDTEMNPLNTARMARKVHALCGWNTSENNNNFSVFNLRSDSPVDRAEIVEAIADSIKPDMLIIDGVRDLLVDFNSIEESGKVIQLLMKLSKDYNICVIAILHTNKSLTDSNMRGHLGTELLNKCAEVYEVKKSELAFEVEQTDTRNEPVDSWRFYLDSEGVPQQMDIVPKASIADRNLSKMRDDLSHILDGQKSLSYTELGQGYSELTGLKTPSANRHIGLAIKKGLIIKGGDSRYRISA